MLRGFLQAPCRVLPLKILNSTTRRMVSKVSFKDEEPSSIHHPRQFKESNIVSIGSEGDDETSFKCDEEPHMLPFLAAGGYCPLQLGGMLKSELTQNEYEVVRKLGWGAHSSVWLCRSQEQRYGAVKVFTRVSTLLNTDGLRFELDLCDKLARAVDADGAEHCIRPVEVFGTRSMHGLHHCLVMRPHAASIDGFVRRIAAISEHGHLPFSPDGVKSLGKQILSAVSCIHSLGFVHTDIKGSNIYLDLATRDPQVITDYLYSHPSSTYEPRMEPSLSPDPIVTVRTEPLPVLGDFVPTKMGIFLGDFGEAIPVEKTAERSVAMPTILRAPEITLGCSWGTAVDIWAVGCFLFEAITGAWGKIFNLDAPAGMTHTEVHLARIEEMLGPFPKSFIERCSKREEFFDSDGHLLKSAQSLNPVGSLRQRLEEAGLDDAELDGCAAFLRRCLGHDPNLRLSAAELSKDPWLTLSP